MTVAGLESLTDRDVHMVGIKGTGMAALAEILVAAGTTVTGSDTSEHFYTDELLETLGIDVREGFDAANIPGSAQLVIHSMAYDPSSHVELVEASRRGLPVATYPEALGRISEDMPSVGIAGVHGKTTTAALCAAIVERLGLSGTVLAGSSLPDLGGRATLVRGNSFFIAETCEYRRAFLSFRPQVVVVTSIESDHLDYFDGEDDVLAAFEEYVGRLPDDGELVYCADDGGAARLARWTQTSRPTIRLTPYGESAHGEGRVVFQPAPAGETRFTVGRQPFTLTIPGRHNALNCAAALIAVARIQPVAGGTSDVTFAAAAREAVSGFRGTKRRSEVVGEVHGITVIDDYAHHPTAIRKTLSGYREFYPGRRIVLDFMSHTYSRTKALLPEFARALSAADVLILHEIYASAREENPGDVSGEILANAVRQTSSHPETVHYVPAVLDALPIVRDLVGEGDLFVTMGAGNNWELGPLLVRELLLTGAGA